MFLRSKRFHQFYCFQKPILLPGHERSTTQIKYNGEGDLQFSVVKEVANVWYSVNGERLVTYNGHVVTVQCVDCDWDTQKCLDRIS
ncbi:eukaryotic translation initiation factor 3 subunit I-like [Cynoglossus semilaevis]|uniref:eukaryotic translation initiation factor 3 subunit I-like n=1 Tax=Cynoglossus semilaevis TaxID=244447 RepID=UPI000D62EFD9|nr:eukaryotic translation initiation factor 3 subunit I-like [Cynoglossus semilaevis]